MIRYRTEDAREECAANAAHIVRCVNAHDDLVALVQRAADAGGLILMDQTFAIQFVTDCRAALAKAGVA